MSAGIRGAADVVAVSTQLVPAAPCDVCGSMVAPSTMCVHYACGRVEARACQLCADLIGEIRARLILAQARQRSHVESQLYRVVREVRAGITDLPTFDQPDLG